jgi:potassium-dependent mechanosensitive channel
VLISISVPRTYDPSEVRGMLSEAAASHGDVLQKPPPIVLFKKLGTATMDFDLICIVAEVDVVGRVTSDLNYVIHKRLVEMEPAAAATELTVRGLDGSIAQAVSRETSQRKGAKSRVTVRRKAAPVEEEPEALPSERAAATAEPEREPPKDALKDDSKE